MKHWPFQPREKRFGVDAGTIIETADGQWAPATILNLSSHGCRIATSKALAIDEHIRLDVEPFGYLAARVVWTCSEGAGLEFVSRLEP